MMVVIQLNSDVSEDGDRGGDEYDGDGDYAAGECV